MLTDYQFVLNTDPRGKGGAEMQGSRCGVMCGINEYFMIGGVE